MVSISGHQQELRYRPVAPVRHPAAAFCCFVAVGEVNPFRLYMLVALGIS